MGLGELVEPLGVDLAVGGGEQKEFLRSVLLIGRFDFDDRDASLHVPPFALQDMEPLMTIKEKVMPGPNEDRCNEAFALHGPLELRVLLVAQLLHSALEQLQGLAGHPTETLLGVTGAWQKMGPKSG